MSEHPTPPVGDPPGSSFVRQHIRDAKAAAKAVRDQAFSDAVAASSTPRPPGGRVTVAVEAPPVEPVAIGAAPAPEAPADEPPAPKRPRKKVAEPEPAPAAPEPAVEGPAFADE